MLSHPWDIPPREAIALQRELAGRISTAAFSGKVATVAGTDCAVLPRGPAHGPAGRRRANVYIVAAAVLCDAASRETLAVAYHVCASDYPYVPGLLSFREAPAVIAAVEKLPRRPDLLLCDGQGIAHPRRLGLASHVGLWLDLPTIGVAKSRLCGRHRELGAARGSRAELIDQGEVVGCVLRTRQAVKPLYISVGHRLSLDQAAAWTLGLASRYRLPEPNRQAHMLVTRIVRDMAGGVPPALGLAGGNPLQ